MVFECLSMISQHNSSIFSKARNEEHCHIYLDHVDDSYTANVAYSNNIVAANIAMSVDEASFRKLTNGNQPPKANRNK